MATGPWMPQQAISSDAWGTILSIGVFIGTVWLCAHSQLALDDVVSDELSNPSDVDVDVDVDVDCDDNESSAEDWWAQRGLRHRLSFHDFSKQADEELRMVDIIDTDEVSFYPKNNNWEHFERYPESERGRENTSKTRGQHQLEESLEGDFYTTNSSGEGLDSDEEDCISLASKSHFVWTEARYHRSSTKYQAAPLTHGLESIPSESQINLPRSQAPPSGLRKPMQPENRAVSLDERHLRHHDKKARIPRRHSHENLHRIDYKRSISSLIREKNRSARKNYNARIMPDKVILVRHGQSMGNISEDLYSTVPDNAMPLTKLGFEQAREAGKLLREQLLAKEGAPSVHFIVSIPRIYYFRIVVQDSMSAQFSFTPVDLAVARTSLQVSPYVRTVETFHGIVSAWCDPNKEFGHIKDRDLRLKAWYSRLMELGLTWHEDPRIREQDFGNYQDSEKIKAAKHERHRFGAFYYRFAHGESASDVFDRISTFLDSLWRSFDTNKSQYYVIITHGIAIRVLLARYFRYSVNQFHLLSNPRNCETIVLSHDGQGRLRLDGRHELLCESDDTNKQTRVNGYKFFKRLRVLPKDSVKHARIRISFDDE